MESSFNSSELHFESLHKSEEKEKNNTVGKLFLDFPTSRRSYLACNPKERSKKLVKALEEALQCNAKAPITAKVSPTENSSSEVKKVRFSSSTNDISTIMPYWNDGIGDSVDSTWYSTEEMNEMKKEIRQAIKCMRKNAQNDERNNIVRNTCCTRGLEHLESGATLKHQQKMKDAVINAVLCEQELQCEKCGEASPVVLAFVSLNKSRWARNMARARALQDEKDVHCHESLPAYLQS